jgi:sec-independent protein translocase protein TatA
MFSDLFDSPWKILIIAAVVLVLFGSKKMPEAARSLGKSMRILKTEISTLHDDENPQGQTQAQAQAQGPQQAPPVPQINGGSSAPSVPVEEPARENQPS